MRFVVNPCVAWGCAACWEGPWVALVQQFCHGFGLFLWSNVCFNCIYDNIKSWSNGSRCRRPLAEVFYVLLRSTVAMNPQYLLSAVAETETDIPHGEPIDSSLSWTAPFQAMEPVTETPEGVFTFPHSHSHRSFKEYVGNHSPLGRAVIPAAILAGYTGT